MKIACKQWKEFVESVMYQVTYPPSTERESEDYVGTENVKTTTEIEI